jgi:hypothetical protein
MFALAVLAAVLATPVPEATPSPSPQRVLGLIRSKFRSHRPPPPFETYTMTRYQLTDHGDVDYLESYTYHIWVRNSDRAALGRRVYRDMWRGDLEFQRPAFNEDRDPGPPTADVFEPAPLHPHPVEFVPSPEPSGTEPPLIGAVTTIGEFDYHVDSLVVEGDLVHLSVTPTRDPDRNRLREIWADKTTYEVVKIVATDKLFVQGDRIYPVLFTYTMGKVDGYPVVTDLHGTVGGGYEGDGATVDFHYRDIKFPDTLPDWYFDKRAYAQHQSQAPL